LVDVTVSTFAAMVALRPTSVGPKQNAAVFSY
jgi:hypothetical protein